MSRSARLALCTAAATALAVGGAAHAQFAPTFELTVTPTKVKANPTFETKLRFAESDAEIGLYTLKVPAGYTVAPDSAVPDVPGRPGRPQGDLLGDGTVTIAAGPGCRSASFSSAKRPVTIAARIYERPVAPAEKAKGAVAVWVLDIEPLNRVRLLVSGSPAKGYTISGAPTPSDNTCNPLSVDLRIKGVTERGVKLLTNPSTPGARTFTAVIEDQDGTQRASYDRTVTTTR